MSGMTTLSPMNTTSATSTAEASCAPPAARPPTTLPSCPCPAAAAAAAAAAGPPPPVAVFVIPVQRVAVGDVRQHAKQRLHLLVRLLDAFRAETRGPALGGAHGPASALLVRLHHPKTVTAEQRGVRGGKKHACAATSSSVSFSTNLEICALVAPARCTTRSASNAPWKNSNTGACDLAMVARADPRRASSVATARASPPGCDIDAASFATARSAAPAGANARETYSRH